MAAAGQADAVRDGRLLPVWPIRLILILPIAVVWLLFRQPAGLDRPDTLPDRVNLEGGFGLQRAPARAVRENFIPAARHNRPMSTA